MFRAIENNIYCVTHYTGTKKYFECDNVNELALNIAEYEMTGVIVSSVTQICCDGSTPKVAIKSNPVYKARIKELMRKGAN